MRRPVASVAFFSAVVALWALALLTACGHPKPAQVNVPPPPPITASQPSPDQAQPTPQTSSKSRTRSQQAKGKEANTTASDPDLAEPSVPADTKPISVETGKASWYGPPYHNRRGSNGEVYNMHAMTAAHRTLPLGSIVRVTNVKTGHSALVRITDRGPFIEGRILDLSQAAAGKIDLIGPGVAEVRMEVLETPVAIGNGGKWAVQIGGFAGEDAASTLADRLQRRYRTAKVLHFSSPTGDWWVRVRVFQDDRERAQQLAAETQTPEGAVFLVRLD
ncbi:MAG TPA: septal ring lytic transglycosylase RlpA family protein [Candidatus Solibacter sp.]|nr:septal ring lytic transglycosylase RlpA family protein [Candidatus Solibacter sp.]